MSSPAVLVFEDDPAAALARGTAELIQGSCIVYPTDTVYGLLAHVESAAAYEAIYRLKNRPATAPLALLAHASCPVISTVSEALARQAELAERFAAGTLTVIVDAAGLPGIPAAAGQIQPGSVGLRCPADQRTRDLLAGCGGLAWATSVNLTGEPPCKSADEVRAWLAGVDAGLLPLAVVSSEELAGTPSSVVDLTGGSPATLR